VKELVAKYLAIPLLRRLFVGAAWSVIGSLLSRVMTLIGTIVIARLLGTEGFGKLVILQSTLTMLGVFAGLGIGVAATKFVAELKNRDPKRLGSILGLLQLTAIIASLAISIVLAFGSNAVSSRIFNMPQLSGMMALASISVFFSTLDGYNNSALIGFEAVKQSVQAGFIAGLVSIPLSIALTWSYGIQGAVTGIVLASVIQSAISFWMLRTILKEHNIVCIPRNIQAEWKVLRDYAMPALFSGAMVAPVHWFCQVLLANTTNGAVEIAILGIGFQWFQAVYFLPLAFGRIVLPVMTDVVAERKNKNAKTVLKSAILANAAVAFPLAFLIGLLSQWIVHMYGVNNINAWLVLCLMVTAASIMSICAPAGQTMIAMGKIWYGWIMNLGWAIVYVGFSYLLLGYGAVGVAGALAIAYFFHTVWVTVWVRKKISE